MFCAHSGVLGLAICSPAMAARMLAMTAATARFPAASFAQNVENSSCFRASKGVIQFGVSRWGVSALRVKGARRDVVVYAGKRSSGPPGNGKRPRSGMQARRKQKNRVVEDDDDDAAAEKALEALFKQLEMDLSSEDGDGDDDVEFTDEELEQMTKELEAAFSGMDLEGLDLEGLEGEEEEAEEGDAGLVDMVMTDGVASVADKGSIQVSRKQVYEEEEDEDEDEEEYEEDDDVEVEERMVPLEKWQIRRLVAAAEKGRRNVNVKSLAAELGMDRSDVLSFLKDPPPELMLMTAQWDLEDEAAAAIPEIDFKVNVVDKAPMTGTPRRQPMSPPTPSGGPQAPRSWHGNKRLKKEHIATFERVYRQSTRPSNAMIENLVNLTHVPRKKVLQWFDDRRAQGQPKSQSFDEAPEN
ncbi:hypothetical protein M758_11G146000 [Ceratodon purpureus]|nr:hypothetical protein M758_11G146000 [Ceratodon purpureus]